MWVKTGMFVVIFIMIRIPVVFTFFMIMAIFIVVFAFMMLICIIMVVVSCHGKLFNTMVRVDHSHVGIDSGDLIQPGVFKGNADGKVNFGFRKTNHLFGFGFIGMWIGTGLHHDADIHQIFANLLHKNF